MYRILLLFCLVVATPLCAHSTTLRGQVRLNGQASSEGVAVKIEADPLWGHADADALALTEKTRGKYPSVVVSGETTTDAQGNFALKVEFTFSDEGDPPTRNVRRDNKQVEVEYCFGKLTVSHEGYRPQSFQAALNVDGDDYTISSMLMRVITIRGNVMNLNDRKPVADLELRFSTTVQVSSNNGRNPRRRTTFGNLTEVRSWTVTTDAKGQFELADESIGPGQFTLTPLGGDFAFSTTSKAANYFYVQEGINELGALAVVPGGSLKMSVVDSDDDTELAVSCTLISDRYRRTLAYAPEDGTVEGFIEGKFKLIISLNGYWNVEREVTIEAGKVADLGEIRMDAFLDLEIIALSDGDTGIETCSVLAQMTEGERPPGYDRGFQVSGTLTVERNKLQRLRRGTWLITIMAAGHARMEVEVTLPRAEPLTVTMQEGGKITATVTWGDNQKLENFSLFAVSCDSDYYPELIKLTNEEWKKHQIDSKRRGVYFAQNQWRRDHDIDAMQPGKYLVIAYAGNFGVLRQDQVEVVKGEATAVSFAPQAPVLTATATRDGKPAAGVKLHLLVIRDWGNEAEIVEKTTDANGRCSHEFKTTGLGYVLTERELAWLGEPDPNNYNWGDSVRRFKGQAESMQYGDEREIKIELNDTTGIWLTIKMKAPEGIVLSQPSIHPKVRDDNWRTIYPKLVDDGYLFPRVPAGDYVVYTNIQQGNRGSAISLQKDIKVDTPPEQTIEIEFDVSAFTVTIQYPDGLDLQNRYTSIKLIPESALDDPTPVSWGRQPALREVAPDASGKAAFIGIEAGRYFVVGSVWDPNRTLFASGNMLIDTSESSEASLELSTDFGRLKLRVEGNPAVGTRQDRNIWRAQFYDELEQEVYAGDPFLAFGRVNNPYEIHGVPTGRYTVVVSGYGLQPVIQHDVEIKRGLVTDLTLTPSAAALLKLTIEGIDSRSLVQLKAQSKYLDDLGQEVEVLAPSKQLFTLGDTTVVNATEAWLWNLTPAVTRVVIKVEGYEDLEIRVISEPGKTILHTAKLKKKAD